MAASPDDWIVNAGLQEPAKKHHDEKRYLRFREKDQAGNHMETAEPVRVGSFKWEHNRPGFPKDAPFDIIASKKVDKS